MLCNIWMLLMLGYMIYSRSSAKYCLRRFVGGKWVTKGDCGDYGGIAKIASEVQAGNREWIVFQRRMDGSVNFYRGWNDYVNGFGNADGEFWLGLKKLHQLTKTGNHELRINMIEWNGTYYTAKYSSFNIAPASDNYRLHVSGYSGNASDAIARSVGSNRKGILNDQQFTTKDADNDLRAKSNCAIEFKGGWWYNDCHRSNLNGLYNVTHGRGIRWYYHDTKTDLNMQFTEMSFR